MGVSQRILELLEIVEWPPELSIDYLRDDYEHRIADGWALSSHYTEEERAEWRELRDSLRPWIEQVLNAKLEPTLEISEESVEALAGRGLHVPLG